MSDQQALLVRAAALESELREAPSRADGSIEARLAAGSGATLFVAGHAVHHWREGQPKFAEPGTGSLALEAARLASSSAFVFAAPAFEDVNYHAPRSRAIIDSLVALLPFGPRLVVDLHGMKARTDGLQVLIGVGRADIDRGALRWAVDVARKQGLEVRFDRDGPYAARGPERLVNHLAPRGVVALQIELSPEIRNFREHPELYLASLAFLVELAGWPRRLEITGLIGEPAAAPARPAGAPVTLAASYPAGGSASYPASAPAAGPSVPRIEPPAPVRGLDRPLVRPAPAAPSRPLSAERDGWDGPVTVEALAGSWDLPPDEPDAADLAPWEGAEPVAAARPERGEPPARPEPLEPATAPARRALAPSARPPVTPPARPPVAPPAGARTNGRRPVAPPRVRPRE